LGVSFKLLLTKLNEPVSLPQEKDFRQLVWKRTEEYPLQYLTGTQNFMSLEFEVNERVLIPRWDTEILVEKALELMKRRSNPRVVDVGTGSGAIAFEVEDTLDEGALTARLEQINGLEFDRVGLHYTVDMIAIKNASGNADTFAQVVKKIAENTKLALILMSDDSAAMEKALETVTARKPLVYAATIDNYEAMTAVAKKYEAPLAVKGANLDELEEVVNKVVALGHKDLVIDPGSRNTVDVLADLTQIRRMAIKKKFRPFGYPVMAFTSESDPMDEVLQAQVYVSKYASLVVLKTVEKQFVLPLLSWRQNLYTDPQKPIQVESKIYEIGAVNENSPVYITTNFSLSYYSVEGEVEASKIPSYIIPVDTDGTSVLTAWAAGKFGGDRIAQVMKDLGIESKVSHRNVVIPGYVAVIAAKLKEESGWNVIVGPRESAGISPFARANFS
jgi:acetyl-CoA decarbonylase/synthase complex subunit gamma